MDLNKISKALVALSAFGVASVATAASYAPPAPPPACMKGVVSVPCESTAWDLGVEVMYVRQASESGNWFWAYNQSETNDGELDRALQHNSKWAWGFRVEGSYHFGQGSDLSVNWTHFQKKASAGHEDGRFTSPYLPRRGYNEVNHRFDSIYSDSKTKFDQVNLELGQHVDYGDRMNVRSHAGLSYVHLRHNLLVEGYEDDNKSDDGRYYYGRSKFSGVGPRFGQDVSYDIGSGFAVYGRYAVSVLAGTSKLDAVTGEIDDNNSNDRTEYAKHSKRAIVAGLETRLGVKYTHAMAAGDLTIDAAYQAVAYQGILMQNPNGTVNDYNWSYHGPSLGIKWVGNA